MNIIELIHRQILHIAEKILQKDFPMMDSAGLAFTVEFPKKAEHGDLSTNIVMVLAPHLGPARDEFACKLVSDLEGIPFITRANIVGAGFINMFIENDFWFVLLDKINSLGLKYGNNLMGQNESVNVEFCSANPTGPMHIGHARSAIYGDALGNLLKKCGYEVTKEYYSNDAGNQIDILVRSLFIRYKQQLGGEIEIPEGCYPGDYLIPVAKKLAEEYGKELLHMQGEEREQILRHIALAEMMKLIKNDLAELGVYHDVFRSEQTDIRDSNKIPEAIKLLKAKKLAYKGIPERPKSGENEDWEPQKQLLLRSTKFGDDLDRTILRADGTNTYFSADIAYHLDKLERGFKHLIILLGADHSGYVKRLRAIVSTLSDDKVKLIVLINQLVNVLKGGRHVKMSKRAGTFVTLREILEELGKDALRFAMLMQKSETVLDLDIEKVLEHSKDNPVFYVQYAHTRAVSVIRRAAQLGIIDQDEVSICEKTIVDPNKRNLHLEMEIKVISYLYTPKEPIDYSSLTNPEELQLIKLIASLPKVLINSATHYEPHRITYYLCTIAAQLHHLWTKGMSDQKLRFINEEDRASSRARVGMVYSVASVIGNCFELLGITPLLEM